MNRSWMLLLVAFAVVIAGVTLLMRWEGPDAIPWTPLVPATRIAAAEPIAEPLAAATDEPLAERVDGVATAAADERTALAEVAVVEVLDDAQRPCEAIEVVMQSAAGEMRARTDSDGVARFAVRGGDGLAATAWCGLGASDSFRLEAAAPVRVELPVRPRLRVQGTVRTGTGHVVADAAIVLLPWARPDGDHPSPLHIARSRADGTFDVAVAIGGRVGAHHRVYGSSPMYLVQAPVRATQPLPVTTLSLLLLDGAAEVSGTVRDHLGAAVGGAEIEFRSRAAAPTGAELAATPRRVRCDAEGRFVATRLRPGSTVFGARARGHGPTAGTMDLAPGAVATIDVQLTRPCTLVGTVRDAAGQPAVAAAITGGEAGAFASRRAVTDATGAFRLDDLPSGKVPLVATGRGRSRATTTLDLSPDRIAEWHVELDDTSLATNVRGLLVDAADRPLAGWTIVARAQSGAPATGKTDATGAFALACAPGRVDLRALAPSQSPREFATAVLRGADPSAGPIRFVVRPEETGAVTAIVQTPLQAPVPATVACWHHERAEHVRFTARADGTLVLPAVPVGTIDLLFEHPGHAGAPRRDLAIGARQTVELGVVELGAGGGLFGNVRGPDGNPPADCALTVLAGAQRFHAVYGGGAYRFPTLPAGAHVLLVQGAGLAAMSFSITVTAGLELQQDVELQAGVPRTVRIEVPPDAPAAIAVALRIPGKAMQWLASGVARSAGGDGRRRIEFVACMAPGTYAATAWAAGGFEARATVTFGLGDESEVGLRLTR